MIAATSPTPEKKRRHRPLECPAFRTEHVTMTTPEDDAQAMDGLLLLLRRHRMNRAAKVATLFALLLSVPLAASDIMHVPLLCKYHQESHAVAGGIVGAIVNNTADYYDMRFIPRLVTSTVVALAAGTFKEYLIDKRARPSEIWPWAAGAVVVSVSWSFKW